MDEFDSGSQGVGQRNFDGFAGFILGRDKIFPLTWCIGPEAKVGLKVFVKREFSGFACSKEQAKNRRKRGETRLCA